VVDALLARVETCLNEEARLRGLLDRAVEARRIHEGRGDRDRVGARPATRPAMEFGAGRRDRATHASPAGGAWGGKVAGDSGSGQQRPGSSTWRPSDRLPASTSASSRARAGIRGGRGAGLVVDEDGARIPAGGARLQATLNPKTLKP